MILIIDRFEGRYAVAEMEDGSFVDIPKCVVPDAVEGDCVSITVDRAKTGERTERIKTLADSLFED